MLVRNLLGSIMLFAAVFHSSVKAEEPADSITSTVLSIRTVPKYQEGFKHWDYVNPTAPKDGYLTLGTQGTYDNFNRYAQRGSRPSGIGNLHDSLFVSNDDEIEVYYGLVAEKAEYAKDYSWIIFYINPKAKYQDGVKVKASDVTFTFNKFYEQGVPQFKKFYHDIKVETLDSTRVKFTLPEPNKSQLFSLASLPLFPEHYYKDLDLGEPLKTPPLGSGPYKVADYKMGQYITYERDENYWAKAHPAKIGTLNFKTIRFDYYLDETVLMEAFKKGEYDIREESIAKNWETQYTGKNFDAGYIKKEEIPHEIPSENYSFIFNIKKPQFADARVRQAIGLMYDFEWSNKNLFYSANVRNNTYFINTKYASSGIPKGKELEILKKYESELPSDLFTKPFSLNKTDGSGRIRKEMRKALKLLKEAGYSLSNNKMVDKEGKPLEFELLIYKPSVERNAIPFQKNLEKIGIKMNIRLVADTSQYINRVREREFDMIERSVGGYPTDSLRIEWHSNFLDSSYNVVGTTDKVIDELVLKIAELQENDEALTDYARAFDRVLLWRHYTIPLWHLSKHRVAYWDKFSRPDTLPKYDLGYENWWVDPDKLKALPKTNSN